MESMESMEKLIEKCEKAKHRVTSLSVKEKNSYEEDLFPRALKYFLVNIMHCMQLTTSIPSGNRFDNWFRLLWERCTMHPNINNWAKTDLSKLVFDNIKHEITTWKLKYLTSTLVHFTKCDLVHTSQYLEVLVTRMTQATQFPVQLTYYQVILEIFDMHRATHYDYLLHVMNKKLGDISNEDIDPKLHLTDMDQYCRIAINSVNRQCKQLAIFSIQCAEANLVFTRLLPLQKNSKLWIDFNLNAKTITIICQRSCFRSERPSIDSEEFDDCTMEILTIDFDHIDKIIVTNWAHEEIPQGKMLSLLLNKSPSYMYDSSCTKVEQANKLLLNIEAGDELNRLLVILPDIFTTRFEIIRNKPETKVPQQNITDMEQSNMALVPYSGRSVSVSSLMPLDNTNLEANTSAQVSVAHTEMMKLIEKCEKGKHLVTSFSIMEKSLYDEDLFPRSLKDFLINIMHCMQLTTSIPSGNRFDNWFRLLWERCTIHPNINNWAKTDLSKLVFDNIKLETITWKLNYLTLTLVHFTKCDLVYTSQYLEVLVTRMTQATQFPVQLTYYQVILEIFDMHRATHYDYLLHVMNKKLGDISNVDIDPKLHLTDMDQYCRIALNSVNRQCKQLAIFSIQCAEANLMFSRLLPLQKNSKLWIDFNLNAKTITIICQRSCFRSERPSIDSEEFDDCTMEILTIDFDHIDKIIVTNWGLQEIPQGKLLSLLLNKSPNYMYESSCTKVEQANKLYLNIEAGDELNRLLVILLDIFTTRFEIIRNKPETKVPQQNIVDMEQSNMALVPYSGRSVSVSSLMPLDNTNLEANTSAQVSVAHTEMMSLTPMKILSNDTPNEGCLSLPANKDDDSVIESSEENKPITISTPQDKNCSQDSGKSLPTKVTPDTSSDSVQAEREQFTKKQSQHSKETLGSGDEL